MNDCQISVHLTIAHFIKQYKYQKQTFSLSLINQFCTIITKMNAINIFKS